MPLRLFLAFSFISAGWDKLSDPTYLNPSARDYIGNQITQMAAGTPLQGFLTNIAVPHANLFGVMVMGGELLIGIAVLLGALTRFSAAMGLLLNLTFFLSATWDIHPFYFGADLPYVFLWLTLFLAGPGPLALDTLIKRWVSLGTFSAAPATARASVPEQVRWKGYPPAPARGPVSGAQARQGNAPRPAPAPQVLDPEEVLTRRTFIGVGAAGLTLAGLVATGLGWAILHPNTGSARETAPSAGGSGAVAPGTTVGTQPPAAPAATATAPAVSSSTGQAPTDTPAPDPAAAAPTDTAAPAAPTATPAPASNMAGKQLIAAPGSLPEGQALQFQLPTGEPAILEHLGSGYSAYVAICTHEGCQVQPIQSPYMGCPCHGAIFDASQDGAAVRGPARRPLSSIPVVLGSDGGVYLAS